MKELRAHQTTAIEQLRTSLAGSRRALREKRRAKAGRVMLDLPTGAGKTVIAAAIVRSAQEKGNRVLFIVDAISLVDQTVEAFWAEGIREIGVIQANHSMTNYAQPVQVASRQTLERRGMPATDLVIVDEAHCVSEWLVGIMGSPEWAEISFIGLSATPWTKGLGNIYDDLLKPVTMQQLIDAGFLSPFRVFASSHPDLGGVKTVAGDYNQDQLGAVMSDAQLVADVVETYRRLGENRPAFAFCVDRAQAAAYRLAFRAATAREAPQVLVSAINGATDLPVTAAVDGTNPAKVNITAKNGGVAAGDIDLRVNYLGAAGGESLPTGLGVTITTMTAGAGNPSLTAGLAALGDMPFDFILCPYTDSASLASIRAFLDNVAGRWMPTRQLFGHAFTGLRGTSSDMTTLTATLNDPHLTLVPAFDSPTSGYVWAAAFMGAAAVSLRADPALPLQTLSVAGLLAPSVPAIPAFSLRNVLLHAGVSTFTVDSAGGVAIENLITTYQQNSSGQPDNSYLELETLFTLAAVIRRFKSVVQAKFARVKVAADGVRLLPGSNVVTPTIIRAEIIAAYRQMEQEDGWVQQSDVFAAGLIVQKSSTTPGRVDAILPAILIEQLRIFAALVQFRLF